ncbi:MAG: MFS transporter, partial [Solirubrobacteraceae bacterium]|nr:MFS transporter [Solirubrobacteraceae bacterium]
MNLRAAITAVFFANGALFATWAARIPAIADRVDAGTGALGLALLGPAVGALVTMPLVGRRLTRRPSRTLCRLFVAALALAVLLPAVVPGVPALAAVLVLVGAANGGLDIAMNAQGVTAERHLRRPILSSLHAAFSFGAFAGAGLGAVCAALDVAPLPNVVAGAVLFGGLGLLAVGRLLPDDRDPDAGAQRLPWRRLPPRLLVMGVACFFCLMAEGGANDWSAKLVDDDLGGTAALGAIAFAAFSLAMAGGRLVADALWARWGAVGLLRRSGALAAAGFGAGLAVGTVPAAIAGFAALGLGLSGVVPTLFRAAADQPGVPTGPALATTSSLGYLGFLAGPPLIGGLGELTSLHLSAALLAVAGLLVVALAPTA